MILSMTVAVVVSYLVGSISFADLVARLRGIDIRAVGSRNPGAANTFREVGIGAGFLVLAADVLKGAVAVYLPVLLGAPHWTVFLTAIAVVVGHNWSAFLGLRGGKGVATVLGISLAMLPLLTLVAALPATLVILLTRNVVVGGALGFIMLNALTIATSQPGAVIALCIVLSVMIAGTHLVGSWAQYVEAIRTKRWGIMLWVE